MQAKGKVTFSQHRPLTAQRLMDVALISVSWS